MATGSSSSPPDLRNTLSEIFNLDPALMQRKFRLEPLHSYDPQNKDNLVFFSPTVLLEDLELRDGGWKDWGAKKVLGILSKDILTSKDIRFFLVPEITHFKMGYGKRSENKNKLAITEAEANAWMKFYDLATWKANMRVSESEAQSEGETPMDVDEAVTLTGDDTQALEYEEDELDPLTCGLKIKGVKSGYLLFFSILLIFYKKKKEPAAKLSNIAENKISDFLLFWVLPYLLYFTEKQVSLVNEHHAAESKENGAPPYSVPSVEMSAMDILQNAFEVCKVSPEQKRFLLEKLRKYYSDVLLEHKYKLPAATTMTSTSSGTVDRKPIILVPLRYQLTKMPAEIEEIGRKWREIGSITLVKEFVDKFVQEEGLQKDFLNDALKELAEKEKFAVDYAILFPDEQTFSHFIIEVEEKYHNLFQKFKCMKEQGLNLSTPRIGLVKDRTGKISVSFSHFKGHNAKTVATLFRIIGAHRLNHFTIAILHGSCLNPYDPTCKLMSLYPVECAVKFELKGGKFIRCKDVREEGFLTGKFCKYEFPETFNSWQEAVQNDEVVRNLLSGAQGKVKFPKFEHQYPLTVAYTKSTHSTKLKINPFGAAVAPTSERHHRKRRLRNLMKYKIRAASLEGCLLNFIGKSGSKGNVGVVLAINDTLEPFGCLLASLPRALTRTIIHFVMAVVVAGLPSVYPAQGSSDDHEVTAGTDDEDSEGDDSDEDDNDFAAEGSQELPFEAAGHVPGLAQPPCIKPGVPQDEVLETLSREIAEAWKPLGRRLKFDEAELTGFHKDYEEYTEKPYQMLLRWKEREGLAATYQILNDALCHRLVGKISLAEKFCYESN